MAHDRRNPGRAHELLPSGERGLTLIELVVAAFIGMIVIAVLAMLLIETTRSTDRATDRADASARVDAVVRLLQQDVTSARAPDRASDATYDPTDFAAAIRAGVPVRGYDVDGDPVPTLDVLDVGIATPTQLRLALPGPDPTCVDWSVGPEGVERRILDHTPGCIAEGAVKSRKLVAAASGLSSSSIHFMYGLAVASGGACATSPAAQRPLDPRERAAILDVSVEVGAMRTRGGPARTQASARGTSMALATRHSREYLAALGCTP